MSTNLDERRDYTALRLGLTAITSISTVFAIFVLAFGLQGLTLVPWDASDKVIWSVLCAGLGVLVGMSLYGSPYRLPLYMRPLMTLFDRIERRSR